MKRSDYHNYVKKHISIMDVCRQSNISCQKRGELYVCSCPRHADEHPSLMIYPETNTYYCFQCGDSGDVFRFVKAQRDCDFHTALDWLEENFPDIRKYMPDSSEEDVSFLGKDGYEIAWQVYEQMSEQEWQQLGQFAKMRRFTDRQLQAAEVIWASGGKLFRRFSKDEDMEQRFLLEEKGLLRKVSKKRQDIQERYEDYFKNDRIIVPLRNMDGSILGFAGRATADATKPKYLFTRGLKKGSFLYRFYNVLQNSKKKPIQLFLVEGIFDAIRLESKGRHGAAVLGSHLTQSQAQILGECVQSKRCQLASICIFMDSDEAGLQGNYRTIRNILKNSVLRKIPLTVRVLTGGFKDPDEYYQIHSMDNMQYVREYSVNEYLFRYFLQKVDQSLTELNIEEEFSKRSSEEKIYILNKIRDILPYGEWKEYFEYLDVIGGNSDSEEDKLYNRIKTYVLMPGEAGSESYSDPVKYYFHMQNAIQVARTSYRREDITLDEDTWERIAAAADVFYPFLYDTLKKNRPYKQPLVRLMVPKKKDQQRPKSMYIHEQLILQQYVLNELLSSGTNVKYENYIPAVRYSADRHSYVTGYDYAKCFEHPVSFAYQVDMDVMNGTKPAAAGMFRNFYDCWKEFIYYIQDGVRRLDGQDVYRVKLDISGFYDHITKADVRNVLSHQLAEALRADGEKFQCFQSDTDSEKEEPCLTVARQTVEWIMDQLYEPGYYDPADGTLKEKQFRDVGIPQGPNLSAYIANIVLFPLDAEIEKCVQSMNETVTEENRIKIRYARYVDDMVIVSSDPSSLLKVKDMIQTWLYDNGFELSPKTDQEDGISKEEAIQWTMDERGGLGVSVGFDFPDDSLDLVLDECVEVEHTDRRTMLKLLKKVLSDVLYDGIPSDQTNFEKILQTVFQTEEIRLNDIVRFSELMIRRAAEQIHIADQAEQKNQTDQEKQAEQEKQTKQNLLDAFLDIWEEGTEVCKNDSLLLYVLYNNYIYDVYKDGI